MARQTKLQLIAEAISIQGYLPATGERGKQYRFRRIAAGEKGTWVTDHMVGDEGGRPLTISDRYVQADLLHTARYIIAHRDEIAAERNAPIFRD